MVVVVVVWLTLGCISVACWTWEKERLCRAEEKESGVKQRWPIIMTNDQARYLFFFVMAGPGFLVFLASRRGPDATEKESYDEAICRDCAPTDGAGTSSV